MTTPETAAKLRETFNVEAADHGTVILTMNREQAAALAETLTLNMDDDTVRLDNDEPERADLICDLARAITDLQHGFAADGQACSSATIAAHNGASGVRQHDASCMSGDRCPECAALVLRGKDPLSSAGGTRRCEWMDGTQRCTLNFGHGEACVYEGAGGTDWAVTARDLMSGDSERIGQHMPDVPANAPVRAGGTSLTRCETCGAPSLLCEHAPDRAGGIETSVEKLDRLWAETDEQVMADIEAYNSRCICIFREPGIAPNPGCPAHGTVPLIDGTVLLCSHGYIADGQACPHAHTYGVPCPAKGCRWPSPSAGGTRRCEWRREQRCTLDFGHHEACDYEGTGGEQ